LRETIGAPLAPNDREEQDRIIGELRARLVEEAFAATRNEGRSMPLDQAVALALQGDSEDGDLAPGKRA
ncbi:MAG TPA: hypothetical protein VFJ58_16175, partial [Armatimonadota bacterium]|nr:hypothetical protein [Armatimonadota bacterium]